MNTRVVSAAPCAAPGLPYNQPSPVLEDPLPMRHRVPALLLALLAALVRLPGLGWGLPRIEEEAFPLKKAFAMWGWDGAGLQLDPQTAGWPSLSFYLHLALQHVQYGLGRLLGRYADPGDFYVEYLLDPSAIVLWARGLGVLAAAGIVYLACRSGQRLAGLGGGLAAGGLLLVSPMLMEQSRLISPDIFLSFFAALAVYQMVRLHQGGRSNNYYLAAIGIALGAACKYTPLLLLPSLYAVHLLRLRAEARSLRALGLTDPRLLKALGCVVLVFLAVNPFFLRNFDVLRRDVGFQLMHMSEGHLSHRESGLGYVSYLRDVLGPGLAGVGLVLCSAGLVLAALRWRSSWLVPLLCILPLYLVLGGLRTQFDRYMLPLLMPLSLGLAALWEFGVSRLPPGARASRAFLGGLLLAVSLLPAIRSSWAELERVQAPSTHQLAERFLEERLEDSPLYLVTEPYSIELPADDFALEAPARASFQRLGAERQHALLDRRFHPYVVLPMYTVRPELTAFYYDLRLYRPYRYFMTSSSVRGRYEAQPARFARQIQFYADLGNYGETLARFSPADGYRGPELTLYRMDEAAWKAFGLERASLPRDFYAPFLQAPDARDFQLLMQSMARHAFDQAQYTPAALYYRALFDTLDPETRKPLRPRVAFCEQQIGELDSAQALYEDWLSDNPEDPQVMVNLGWIRQHRGDLEGAVPMYRRVLELDDGEPARWARERLNEIEAEKKSPRR